MPRQSESSLSGLAKWFSGITGAAKQALVGSKSPGLIESAQTINSTVWRDVAANAWAYFQPGVGVDSNTGLPYAGGSSFRGFTDWDLGVYIQAVIDAQELGLIGAGGAWGSDARIDKILTFLENRPLNAAGYPFQFYDATTGKSDSSLSSNETADVVDTGRLFVALNRLIAYNPGWKQPIDNFVYNTYGNRSNYAALVPSREGDDSSNSIYAYYIDSGYASFWPQQLGDVPNQIMNNIFNSSTVTAYNVTLPDAPISCDPLLCSVFELNNNNSQLMGLMNQVYLAHEAYYDATGHYVAFSEGSGFLNDYIYEWVVASDGSTWKITTSRGAAYAGNAVIYNKVAFSFLALYNTTFARNTVVYLEKVLPNPTNGYSDGADNTGHLISGVGSDTNGLILDAALYAIQHGS
ncbi:MAG: DUF3131 domain-containing protein [Candidatus Bathyarchaeia archaeon]